MIDLQQTLSRRIVNNKEEDINSLLMNHQEESEASFPEYKHSMTNNNLFDIMRSTMTYRGTLLNPVTMISYKVGYTYKIEGPGKYMGINCINGDLLVAIKDSGYMHRNSDWVILRSNREKISDGRPGYLNSNIAETRDIIIGIDSDTQVTYSTDDIEISYLNEPYKQRIPTMVTPGYHSITKPQRNDMDDAILSVLRVLAAQPSMDPYKENKLKKDDSILEAEMEDINTLRGLLSKEINNG